MARRFPGNSQRGLTLVELAVAMGIIAVLAALILPLGQMTSRRMKEIELRRDLRTMRTAIDDFKKTYDRAVDEKKIIPSSNKSGYPESLEQLVEGYDFGGLYKEKRRYLRRIPPDPFNPPLPGQKPEWGVRSVADEPDSRTWGGQDVFDVYSLSEDTAIDGTTYKDW